MKIADGELRQLLTYDVKLAPETVRELVADSKQTGRSLLQTVLASKLADEGSLAKAQAKRIGVPFINLGENPIPTKTLHRLPRQIAAKYRIVCFDETATSIKLAMTDPRDEQARKAVKDYTNKTVRRYQATTHDLTIAMRGYASNGAPLPFTTRDLIATILEQAIGNNSHDIHFEPHGKELVVKRRVGRRLQIMSTLPLSRMRALISWCKLQSGNDVADTERAHHGRFSIRVDGSLHDVIMSTIPVVDGEKMVLRLVPPASSIPTLKSIGYGTKEITEFEQLLNEARGLVIVAGTTGSKIKTTLASLAKLASQQAHATVTSVEEPLSYTIDGATQIEVTHALPFSDIIGTIIAQGPETIVTSQLGKGDAAEQLIDFSLSQHLVISGFYAHSLQSTITKLMNHPIPPALIAASLRLLVVQHQVDALCSRCRTSFTPTGPLKKALWEQFSFSGQTRLYRQGPGCDACIKGVNGTVLATEWLPVSHELQQLLATGADAQTLKQYLNEHDSLVPQLATLASKGIISIDEATQRVT